MIFVDGIRLPSLVHFQKLILFWILIVIRLHRSLFGHSLSHRLTGFFPGVSGPFWLITTEVLHKGGELIHESLRYLAQRCKLSTPEGLRTYKRVGITIKLITKTLTTTVTTT